MGDGMVVAAVMAVALSMLIAFALVVVAQTHIYLKCIVMCSAIVASGNMPAGNSRASSSISDWDSNSNFSK